MLVQPLAESRSLRPCIRSKLQPLWMAQFNHRPCQPEAAGLPMIRLLCRDPMSSLEIFPPWDNLEVTEPKWAWAWEQPLAITETWTWIGLRCRRLIIRSFHKIFIE